ncbi:MAG: MBL fold metallo-hydrolase, partial [Acidimicrobiia bacterium]
IECGPSVTLPYLTDALDHLGIGDVATVAVTHIHLDHAGGAGHLARQFPGARVAVHDAGARHLIDPARLWKSATRIYGEDGMAQMWGPMEPIDRGRLHVLAEGSTIPLGDGTALEVMYTPGHAVHHVVVSDPGTGAMFVGDAVGLAFPHGHLVQPNTPPPDLDPPALVAQLHRMAEREPQWLGFAHFGVHSNPSRAFDEAEQRLDDWLRYAAALPRDEETAADQLRDWVLSGYRDEGFDEEMVDTYDKNTFWPMHVTGMWRWLDSLDDGVTERD